MSKSAGGISRVLVTENIVGPGIESLRNDPAFETVFKPELYQRPERIEALIGDFAAIIVRNQTPVTAAMIAAAHQLRVIARAGVGLENIDTPAATKAGIVVVYAPSQNSISVAELSISLMLALARRICEADRSTRNGHWLRHEFTGTELYGKTLGLLGLGRIGFLTAMRGRAFGMNIVAHDPFIDQDTPAVVESHADPVPLDELLRRADFVSCHLPATDRTRGLIDFEALSLMKPTAYLINTSRGEIVDETGLVRALAEKRIAGAALDVRQTEPPCSDAISRMDQVILTPHVGAFTHEAQQRVVASISRDVRAVLAGKPAINFANFPHPQNRRG